MASDRVIVVDGVEHHFPADATDEEVSAALNSGNATHSTKGGALPLLAAGQAVPATANLAVEAATNPGVPKAMSVVGQIVGGIEGLRREGPLGAAAGAWTGGKAGYFTGKLLQRIGAPVASVMDKLAPYAQTLSTVGGAAGVDDLAQMAEPDRKDIGFLGIGGGTPDPKNPALLNAIYAKLRGLLSGSSETTPPAAR